MPDLKLPELMGTLSYALDLTAYRQLVERALPARSTMTALQPELGSRQIEPGQSSGAGSWCVGGVPPSL